MTRAGRDDLAAPLTLNIASLGQEGDGLATTDAGTIAVAYSLPGERVIAWPAGARRANLDAVVEASPERVAPPCTHFGACGGCALQHWADEPYAAWKHGLVTIALRRAGFEDPSVAPLVRTPPHARRRIDLAVGRADGKLVLGLHRAHAKDIVDIAGCTMLHPKLLALVAPLRTLLASLTAIRATGAVLLNLLDSGADILVRGDGALSTADRTRLAAFATENAIPRIAWGRMTGTPEITAQNGAPYVTFGDRRVEPPPGTFLQASAEGERAIVAAVLAGLPANLTARAHAVELFAGCGTISLPLAARLRVVAYEGDAAAAAALRRAAAGGRVDVIGRGLVRQPLQKRDFAGASAIILDPPFAGAAPQMPAIAESGIRRVIYVSCNPTALARDSAVLREAGYRLLQATPIDQFLWSAHVECVAVFEKR